MAIKVPRWLHWAIPRRDRDELIRKATAFGRAAIAPPDRRAAALVCRIEAGIAVFTIEFAA